MGGVRRTGSRSARFINWLFPLEEALTGTVLITPVSREVLSE
jgi:hypothetical protein